MPTSLSSQSISEIARTSPQDLAPLLTRLVREAYTANPAEAARVLTAGIRDGLPEEVAAPVAAAEDPWPEVSPLMFHGLAGDIVKMIEPHTEADPVALLVQLLAAFGSAIGRSAHFTAEADQHFGNLYVVMVGISAKGRKGTSLGHVRRLFALAAPQWEGFCVQSGLSSGEGLIWHVRDAQEKLVKNKTTGEMEPEVIDPGVPDKRLLVVESEYASVLRVASRDGNTLSAILRDGWDRGRLQTMTKNNAAQATGAHVSLIGHVTADELRRELSSTEAGRVAAGADHDSRGDCGGDGHGGSVEQTLPTDTAAASGFAAVQRDHQLTCTGKYGSTAGDRQQAGGSGKEGEAAPAMIHAIPCSGILTKKYFGSTTEARMTAGGLIWLWSR